MAHELEMINGMASFVSVREPAWHGLGVIVEEDMTAEQVLKLGKLDYKIELSEVIVKGNAVNDHYAITRNDRDDIVFGFVKDRYTPIQNEDAFIFFDEFLDRTDAVYQTAGVLKSGEIAWMLAKFPEHITIADSPVEMYCLAAMYHNGKAAMQLQFTPIRVVCNNTLTAATASAANKVSVRHNVNYAERMKEAVRIFGIKNEYQAQMREIFADMAATKVTTKKAEEYFNKVVTGQAKPDPVTLSTRSANKIQSMIDYYMNHSTQQNIKGSVWGLYNGVTGYYQNFKEYTSAEKRFNNIFIGGDAQRDSEQAFHLANMMI